MMTMCCVERQSNENLVSKGSCGKLFMSVQVRHIHICRKTRMAKKH